jgi:hypothetical protein
MMMMLMMIIVQLSYYLFSEKLTAKKRIKKLAKETNSVALSPQANYTD